MFTAVYLPAMGNEDTNTSGSGSRYSLKERLELERWARLHDMSLEEYLESGIQPSLEAYRSVRDRRQKQDTGRH